MTIAFKLRIFFTAILLVSLIFSYSFWQSSKNLARQGEVNKTAQALIQTAFEFGGITNEYINNPIARVKSQWHHNHKEIEKIFTEAPKVLIFNDDKQSLKKIISNEAHAKKLIEVITNEELSTHKRKQIQLASQIRVQIQGMLSEASRMSKRSLNRLTKAEQQLEYTSLTLLLTYLLIFIISLILIKYKILNPIINLQNNAEKLAQGEYDSRIPESGNDELSSLATSYNKLAVDIQNKIKSLTQQSDELSSSKQELLKLNNNLQELVDEKTGVLKNSENKQRAILESMSDGIVTLNNYFIIQDINPAITKMFGYSSADSINKNINFIVSDLKDVKKDDGKFYEKEGLRKTGSNFPIEVSLNKMMINDTIVFNCIIRDITERKRVQKLQGEFVSNVSHELRTPLTSIRGALGLVNSGALDAVPEKANELLTTAYNNTERLMNLINDLLDMQKIEAGKLDFNIETVDLSLAIEKAITDNISYAKQHNAQIKLGEFDDSLKIKVDPLRLDQIMSNLLSNAAKFCYEGTSILIHTAIDGSFAKISVKDSGEGIPKEFFDTIFSKFTQNDASATRAKGGTGLGLAISKQMVESMSGSIDFNSVVGEGTTFNIYLPLAR